MKSVDPVVMARCNMFGVIRNVEYLVEKDPESRAAVDGVDMGIRFKVKNCFTSRLTFSGGAARLEEELPGRVPEGKVNISLYFTSPEHFNNMVAGKANPIPLKGLGKIGFLKGPFTTITDRIEHFLRADEEALAEEATFRMNTEMMVYTAFFALAEIANHDTEGRRHAASIPDGVLQLEIGGGPEVWIYVHDGKLTPHKGRHPEPRAYLSFCDLQAAHDMLNGKVNTFTSVGLGAMEIRGFIPMIEHLNPILDLVSRYLA